ncbi:MAG: ATPase central domain protein, partial [Phycisphaerales bacterium]|nr:ATPase central domain protein [Phycisphaerales bacterium]
MRGGLGTGLKRGYGTGDQVVAKLAVYKSLLESARDRAALSDEQLAEVRQLVDAVPSGMQRVELDDYPMVFLRALLEDPKLKANQRAVLALHIHGVRESLDRDTVYRLRVGNPIEFGSAFAMLGRQHPSAEFTWNGRWYPVVLQAAFQEDESKLAKVVYLQATLGLVDRTHQLTWHVDPALFVDERGEPRERTVLEVIERFGLRRLQLPAADHNLRLVRAERTAAEAGTQVWVRGNVVEPQSRFWFGSGLSERPLGTPEVPRRAVVEPTLGVEDRGEYGYFGRSRAMAAEGTSRLPVVRVFSLDLKAYVYADVDDLVPYEYDETALSRLFLPEKMRAVLGTLFSTPTDQLFGDLIRGKHGGIVILASGNPGVGKTLTAEVYAEMARRPLYVLEFGELGTTVEVIERNLGAIFARVVRWQAVLQFDECEIFLSQRGDDLERSAIVGIFLRMLDYYEGLLFLTTNRPDTLDYAIRSRVMLRLEYPDLGPATRADIWAAMLRAANVRLTEGDVAALAAPGLNGRQIRNLVR